MADIETITPAPVDPTINAAAIQAAPTVTAPVAAPTPEVPTVAVTVTPPAPVEPSKVEPVAPIEKTLLAVEPPKVEEPAKPAEGGQSVEPAPPPEVVPVEVQFEPFSLPEGIQLDTERMSEFTNILKSLETEGKADHALLQTKGQELVNFHVNEVNKAINDIQKYYETTWEKQKTSWKEEFLADPMIGGNRFQTTIDSALEFIRTYGGTEDEQKEFRTIMDSSGLGNNKAMIRILASAMSNLREGQPLSASKPIATPKSRITTMYGNS